MKKSTFKNGVILVDDNVIYHHFMQKCIERLNLRVPFYFYSTADEIFDHLHMVDIGKYPMPDLILLDIHLRGISGFDILKEIRSRKKFSSFPRIIVFSVSSNPSDIEKAHALNADFQEKFSSREEAVSFFKKMVEYA